MLAQHAPTNFDPGCHSRDLEIFRAFSRPFFMPSIVVPGKPLTPRALQIKMDLDFCG